MAATSTEPGPARQPGRERQGAASPARPGTAGDGMAWQDVNAHPAGATVASAGVALPSSDDGDGAAADGAAEAANRRWLNGLARFGGHWSRLAAVCGAVQAVAVVGQAAALAWLLHVMVIVGDNPFSQSLAWLALPACLLVRALAGVAREEAGQRASERIRQALRTALLDQVHALGPAWRDGRQAGALSATLLEQVEAVDGYFARYRPQQWLAVVVPLVLLAAVLPFSWAAAGILLLTAPLIPLFMILVGWGAKARQTRQMLALQRMSGYFLDCLRGLPTLRLLDAQQRQADAVARIGEDFRVRTMSVLRLAFLSGTVLEFFASVAIALTAVYLGFSLLGHLNFGFYGARPDLELTFFILLLAPEFYQPLRDLGTHYHARAEALAAAGALRAVLLAPAKTGRPDAISVSDSAVVDGAPPSLQLRAIGFQYREGEPVLSSCDLSVQAGEAVAIVGPSGGGKTTLLRLLLGQLHPSEGVVRVNGQALDGMDLAQWREGIGWMSQHPQLLAASLADNLRVARADADDAALRHALQFAGLDAWFASLPQGLQTPLGEGGRPLSGGQLRRLALARVWLRPARLLLLDEPTASLDADTEAFVVQAIARLRQGRTMVLLSHRHAPLALADRILALQDGRLAAVARDDAMAGAAMADAARHDAMDCQGATQRHDEARRHMASSDPGQGSMARHHRDPSPFHTLLRYSGRLAGAGGWLAGAWLLGIATLVGSLGLLGLSGWFLSATAVAGLSPVTAMAFNFFLPGAGVRFFAILRTVSRWAERVVSHEATFRLIASLRHWLYLRLSRLSPSQLGSRHGGDLLNTLVRDVDALDNLYPRVLLPVGAGLVMLSAVALLAGWLSPRAMWLPLGLGVFGLVVLPVAGWLLGRRLSPRLLSLRAQLRRDLVDSIDGLQDFSLHAPAWLAQRERVLSSSRTWLRLQRSAMRRGAWLRAGVVMSTGLAAGAAVLLLAGQGLSGPWIAALAMVMLGAQELLMGLPAAFLELPGTAAAAVRVDALASQTPSPAFVASGRQPQGSRLQIDHLGFAWPDQPLLFAGLSLDIAPGEHVALLGPSGGGKSSLVQLLSRLEDPQSGVIRLGGVDLCDMDEPTLRRHLACAGQFPWAQTATLADNLRLADPDADDAAMMEALRIVGLDAQVSSWRDGLQTWVEEGGASLSGGQRRRLGIARALLRHAPITVLDEPTEGLDAADEQALIAAVRAALRGRTLVWVTHRTAGLDTFDRVLRLASDGQLPGK